MKRRTDDPPREQPGGLRASKRRHTETRIQDAALALFERHGFDAVTMDQVAESAEVSVATVYRYFVTKENLVLQDPLESELTDAIVDAIHSGHDIPGALVAVLAALPNDAGSERTAGVRIRLTSEVPSIAGAAHIRARARADQFIDALAHPDPLVARVQALATLAALEAATDHWLRDPDSASLRDLSLAAVRSLASTT
jgi:AcrR family transcriptional regulator